MEDFHKRRINENIQRLIDETHYDSLVNSIERANKEEIIPIKLLTQWKERRGYGWSTNQMNGRLYSDIQRRGPHAFSFLVECLQNSGQENLACLLEPSLSIHQSEDADAVPLHNEYYSDEGSHFVFIDNGDECQDECQRDREVLKELFTQQLGYQELEDHNDIKDDVASLIVVNFCLLNNRDGVKKEREWFYEQFNKVELEAKPTILLSLRYDSDTNPSEISVAQDSGRIKKWFRNAFQVQIIVDGSKRKAGEVSREVQHLIQVFANNNDIHFEDKVRVLQGEFKKFKMKPLKTRHSGFSKRFQLCKLQQARP